MPKNRKRIKFSQTLFFFIFQNLLYVHDIILSWNIYRRFLINQCLSNSLGVPSARPHSFRPVRGFIMSQKLFQSALKSFLRTSGNIKFSRGRSPEPPLQEGVMPPFVLSPYSCLRHSLMSFHGRTTFQKSTTALLLKSKCRASSLLQ